MIAAAAAASWAWGPIVHGATANDHPHASCRGVEQGLPGTPPVARPTPERPSVRRASASTASALSADTVCILFVKRLSLRNIRCVRVHTVWRCHSSVQT